MNRLVFIAGLVLLVFLASFSLAEIPRLINYQGLLAESDGTTPVQDGQYNLRFKIYGSLSGNDSLWWENHTNVDVTKGLFNVILGGTSSLDLPFDTDYWLGITVGTDPELSPRIRLTSVGYAYRALVADSAEVAGSGGGGENSGWLDIGTVVRLQNNQDSVGIGTALPAEKLHVVGDIRLSNFADIAFGDDNTRIYESGVGLHFIDDNDIYLQPDDDIYIRYDEATSDFIRIDPEAKEVGIGTTEPTEILHVENPASGGAAFIKIETSHATNFHEVGIRIQTPENMWHLRMDDDAHNNLPDTGSLALRSQNSGKEVMVWTDDGHVGIGTTSPSSKLDVNGDLEVTGAFKGDISSYSGSDGAPFPRPAYDSGWWEMSQGQLRRLIHNIGGDVDNYVVEILFWDSVLGINTYGHGGYTQSLGSYGGYWSSLTDSTIDVKRWADDYYVDKIRIRIWVYK